MTTQHQSYVTSNLQHAKYIIYNFIFPMAWHWNTYLQYKVNELQNVPILYLKMFYFVFTTICFTHQSREKTS